MSGPFLMKDTLMPALIPELAVTDYQTSLHFYRDILGWQVLYTRPEEGFAMLALGEAQLMIDAITHGRNFDATLGPDDRPFGRGLNLEIDVPAIGPMLASLKQHGHALHLPPEEAWYRTGDHMVGQHQFIVADPDGYLLRFVESLGTRPVEPADAP